MSLKEIFCQGRAISVLQRSYFTGRGGQSYIFSGLEGVGKFRTAAEWAKVVLCKNPRVEDDFVDSCGECDSCRLFAGGGHPDFNIVYKELKEFTKDGKRGDSPIDMPIDVIREFLVSQISVRPTVSKKRVFIIKESESLNAASQNALLKSLEEPPEYCLIILLCSRLESLLATTKSRCQIIRFSPIDETMILKKLREAGVEQERSRYLARFCGGSFGVALRLSRTGLYELKKDLVGLLVSNSLSDCLVGAEKFLAVSKQLAEQFGEIEENASKSSLRRLSQKTLIRIAISVFDDAMKLCLGVADSVINIDQAEQIGGICSNCSPEQWAIGISQGYRSINWVESNVNERLSVEHLLLKRAFSDTIEFLE